MKNNKEPKKLETAPKDDSTAHHTLAYHEFSHEEIDAIRTDLLAWYHVEKRSLPWRKDFNKNASAEQLNQRAYEVWISEIMLQQTQVNTVIAYFERWIKKWPTLADLSKASDEEVRQLWSGLGYYSRATRILEAAQYIMTKLNGNFPSDPITLEKQIPGIGPYTAGAISSIAFNTPAELVDGNVIRVLSRLRSIAADPKAKTTIALHWKLAQDLIHPEAPGDFNQALMDLGATICTPTGPVPCSKCPISRQCHAYAEWTQKKHTVESNVEPSGKNCSLCLPSNDIEDGYAVTRYPVKVMRKEQKTVTSIFYIFEKPALTADSESSFLFTQRPSKGLLASLWQLPTVDLETGTTTAARTPIAHSGLAESVELGSFVHLFTHIKQTVIVRWVPLGANYGTDSDTTKNLLETCGMDASVAFQWLSKSQVREAAIIKSVTKALDLLDDYQAQQKKKRSKGSMLHYFQKKEKL